MSKYPKENIPNQDYLYRHVPKGKYRENGKVKPGAFSNSGKGMSTDWSKYSTPEDSLNRHDPQIRGGVVKLMAGNVRRIPNQIIEHTPNKNRAHTDVCGEKNTEIRIKFTKIYDPVIHPTLD